MPDDHPHFECSLCSKTIPHGRWFFALTGDRIGCLRCVERHDLYDEIEPEPVETT